MIRTLYFCLTFFCPWPAAGQAWLLFKLADKILIQRSSMNRIWERRVWMNSPPVIWLN